MIMKIEIVRYEDEEVVKTIECGDRTIRQVEKVDDGVNINLNHELYYTRIVES